MESTKICIIEDYQDLLDTLINYLTDLDYEVSSYTSAEEFFEKRDVNFKGVYLVDWKLPGESGISIIERIRTKDKISPIFMMSAFNREEEILTGLQVGADDYITKPFNFEQLMTKIGNAQERLKAINSIEGSEDIQILPEAHGFIRDGETVILTIREFIIFQKLYSKTGEAVSRKELIEDFKNDDKMTLRNIDVHVFSLRRKISSANFIIDTVRGIGYKLIQA